MTTTQARTDIHRPSAEEFDPEAYEYVDAIDFKPADGYDGSLPAERKAHRELIERYIAQGYKFAEHVGRSHNCGHCGANLRYAALLVREDAKELIYVGETCLDHRFDGLSKADFQRLRKQAQLDRERQAIKLAFNATCEQYPAIGYATYAANIARNEYDGTAWALSTLEDIAFKARKYGTVSAKQAAFADRLWGEVEQKQLAFLLREAAKAANPAGPAPRGRQAVTGEVISVKDREGYMGGTEWKMTVLLPNGSRVWGTVPSALLEGAWDGSLKGREVTFTASFEEPNDAKVDFAFFKRPTTAKVVVGS